MYSVFVVFDFFGFRVENSYLFVNIGVDFVGLFYVKNVFGGELKMYKVYIVLYICVSIRVVYFDLVFLLDV